MSGSRTLNRRRNRRTMIIVVLTAVILSFMAVRGGLSLQAKADANQAELEKVNALIREEKERTEELNEYSERIGTEEFAVWYARTKMHLVTDDELVIQGTN